MTNARIVATGSYLPERLLTNKELEGMVDTTDEWILARTGISVRHLAKDDELTSHMAIKAAKAAMESANIKPEEIDLVIVATTTPDTTFPSTAVKVQVGLGLGNVGAFDVQAVCSGFVYALAVANNFIKAGEAKKVLVVGAEKMSSIIDWNDRGTCILFGDGAGAVILEATDNKDKGVIYTKLNADGNYENILYTNGGVSSTHTAGTIVMVGQEVFKHAVSKMVDSINSSLAQVGLTPKDISLLIPHQANIRILDLVAKKLGLSAVQLYATVGEHGNTSAASIPLALDKAFKAGRIKENDIVVFEAIGGGLTWGTAVVRW